MKNDRSLYVDVAMLLLIAVCAGAVGVFLGITIKALTTDASNPTPGDWVQAAATIIGAGVSGGVAAFVAIWILHREERAREHERRRAATTALSATEGWLENLAERIGREAIAVAEYFPTNDQNRVRATLDVLERSRLPEALQLQIAQNYQHIFRDIMTSHELIDQFCRPLERSGERQVVNPNGFSMFSAALMPDDIRDIAVLPDKLAMLCIRLGDVEPGLAVKASSIAEQLFRATDRAIDTAHRLNGVVFNNDHVAARPDWYNPT